MKPGLAVLLVSFVFVDAAAQTASPEDLVARAVSTYLAGDIVGAIGVVDRVIAQYPRDYRGYLNKAVFIRQLALTSAQPRLLDSAVVLLGRAGTFAPTDSIRAIVSGNIGATEIERGHFNAAAAALEASYALSRREFYRVRASYALARQGDFAAAIGGIAQLSEEAVSAGDSPENKGLSAYNIGLIFALAGRAPDAVKWLECARSLDPKRHNEGFRRDTDLDRIRGSREFQLFLNRHAIPRLVCTAA